MTETARAVTVKEWMRGNAVHRGPPAMESNNKKRAVEQKTTYNKVLK
jgi:hypothetical protein